jgi:multidrug resistance efflux pump
VVADILKAYSGFVRDYLEGAADFARKYRRARAFIKSRDPNYLAIEVRTLEKRVADGEKGLEKTLTEKKSTLHRLEGMVDNQPVIRNGIDTIQATLESLEASIAEAESDPGRQKEIMDQIQLTLSSTGTAIEKTLVAVGSSDQAIKQG